MSGFTTPSDTQYDKDCHLFIDNSSIDSRDNPQLLKVTLKQSKTDPFRVSVDLSPGLQEQPYAQLNVFSFTFFCVVTTRPMQSKVK